MAIALTALTFVLLVLWIGIKILRVVLHLTGVPNSSKRRNR